MLRLSAVLFFLPLLALAQESGQRMNRTIELLEADQPVFGTFLFDMSDELASRVARSGLDFVIIDMEHRPYDVQRLRSFLLAMTDKRAIMANNSLQMAVTPIVRLPTSNVNQVEMFAKQALNMGAYGLMFPTVNSREQALRAIRASRYPQEKGAADLEPAGLRGIEPGQPATWYWGMGNREYYEAADLWPLDPQGEILVVLQIETAEGVANIEEIVSVPGIGAILVGSYDLATALGIFGDFGNEALVDSIARVKAACDARGIPVGITAGDIEQRIADGYRFLNVRWRHSDADLERALNAAGRSQADR